MKNFSTTFFILISCLLQAVSATESPWYEIEILVFEQSNQESLKSEKWDTESNLPDTHNSLDFLTISPSVVPLKEICVQGEIVPVLGVIPVHEVNLQPADTISEIAANKLVDPVNTVEQLAEEKPFIILDKELNKLNELNTSLRRRSGYRPLLHISWRQPIAEKSDGELIRLYAGKNYSDNFNPDGDARINIARMDIISDVEPTSNNESLLQPPIADSGFPFFIQDANEIIQQQLSACQQQQQFQAEQRHADVWQLDGNIKLYVERYLHVETDLILRIPGQQEIQLGALETSMAADRLLDSLDASGDDNNNGFGWQLGDDFLQDNQNDSVVLQDVLNNYSMQQSRRLRRDEIHYIDHPLFGLLIQIRAYDKPSLDMAAPEMNTEAEND